MRIIGKKVIIRDFEESDFLDFFDLIQDKNNHELSGIEYTTDKTKAKEIFKRYLKIDTAFVIADLSDKMIGIIEMNLRGISGGLDKTREIGFVIDQNYRRQGLGSEAIKLVIDYGFDKMNLTEIWASVKESNKSTQKLLDKFDFKYIYESDQSLLFADNWETVKYYLLKA